MSAYNTNRNAKERLTAMCLSREFMCSGMSFFLHFLRRELHHINVFLPVLFLYWFYRCATSLHSVLIWICKSQGWSEYANLRVGLNMQILSLAFSDVSPQTFQQVCCGKPRPFLPVLDALASRCPECEWDQLESHGNQHIPDPPEVKPTSFGLEWRSSSFVTLLVFTCNN